MNLTVGNEAATWKFTVTAPPAPAPPSAPAATTLQPGTDAELPLAGKGSLPAPAMIAAAHHPAAKEGAAKPRPSEEGQISSNTQWASGSNPPDSNMFSVAERMSYEDGPWQMEVNGSGLLNSTLNPEVQRTSHGRVNDYVIQLGYKRGKLGGQSALRHRVAGAVHGRAVCDGRDSAAGGRDYAEDARGHVRIFCEYERRGAGRRRENQLSPADDGGQLPGAIAQVGAIPADVAQRTRYWRAHQRGLRLDGQPDHPAQSRLPPKSTGDVYGALLNIHLNPKWLWSSEYAFSRENREHCRPGFQERIWAGVAYGDLRPVRQDKR